MIPGMYAASASLADPIGSSVVVAAISWIEGTVLGIVATTLAVVAVAGIGLMMLAGRVPIRRGATVIFGCFILFGAPGIAMGIQSAVRGQADPVPPRVAAAEVSPLANVATPAPPSAGYDPYAGASVPLR